MEACVLYWNVLQALERTELMRLVQVFVAEREWEGCQGMEITGEVKVTIARQSCLLLLG
ncbi:MAG: hypothetical protein M2R45_01698 [Verrucomicrobia subdivision 3 bacterium]|nr:hypothetical protein [Limisphaerales bacterium]MCS1413437.1 hypothetical protein [Limisphaerales bacterium]